MKKPAKGGLSSVKSEFLLCPVDEFHQVLRLERIGEVIDREGTIPGGDAVNLLEGPFEMANENLLCLLDQTGRQRLDQHLDHKTPAIPSRMAEPVIELRIRQRLEVDVHLVRVFIDEEAAQDFIELANIDYARSLGIISSQVACTPSGIPMERIQKSGLQRAEHALDIWAIGRVVGAGDRIRGPDLPRKRRGPLPRPTLIIGHLSADGCIPLSAR